MIPELTAEGYLPLGRYRATESEIESRFVTGIPTPRRAEVWSHWLQATSHLRALVPVCAAWLGGSFLSEKPEPDDVDVLYVIGSRELLTARFRDANAANVLAAFSNAKQVRETTGLRVDTYIYSWNRNTAADLPRLSHGESYMQRGYWDELWSRRLNGPKGSRSDADAVPSRGFLEVVLDGYNA